MTPKPTYCVKHLPQTPHACILATVNLVRKCSAGKTSRKTCAPEYFSALHVLDAKLLRGPLPTKAYPMTASQISANNPTPPHISVLTFEGTLGEDAQCATVRTLPVVRGTVGYNARLGQTLSCASLDTGHGADSS